MKKKHFVKQCVNFGTAIKGRMLPLNCVYGKCNTSHGLTYWYCDDLVFYNAGCIEAMNFYSANDTTARQEECCYIDVHIYDEARYEWIERRIHCGQIYRDLRGFMIENDLIGVECVDPLGYQRTFQSYAPYGRRRKDNSLREVNKRYQDRGSKGGRYTWELRKDTGLISI